MQEIKELLAARVEKLKQYLQEHDLDAALILKPENVFYYSNFNPVLNSHPCYVVVHADGSAKLLAHCLRGEHVRQECGLENVGFYGKWGANRAIALKPVDALHILLGDGPLRLGVEMDVISCGLLERLRSCLNIRQVKDISVGISMAKMVKDAYEISRIRRAAKLVDVGVRTTIAALSRGLDEARACTEGQYQMRQVWSDEFPDSEVCGFGTSEGGMVDSLHVWCLSNGHIAYGTDCPKAYVPQRGDVTLPMAWAKVDGYHAENERTLAIGTLSGTREKAYRAVLEAREAVFSILRPGVLFEDLYKAAVGVFQQNGFEDILPGRVGHGVGNSAHEFPSLESGNQLPLQAGMVITVEPGLMDGVWGGVRHSDTVLITDNGYERLTRLDNGFIQLER